jgi:hypothetical protein
MLEAIVRHGTFPRINPQFLLLGGQDILLSSSGGQRNNV